MFKLKPCCNFVNNCYHRFYNGISFYKTNLNLISLFLHQSYYYLVGKPVGNNEWTFLSKRPNNSVEDTKHYSTYFILLLGMACAERDTDFGFDLVTSSTGISIFLGYLMPKPSL